MGVDSELSVIVAVAAVLVGLSLLVPAALTASRLWKAIEARHPEVWKNLGEPRLGPMSAGQSKALRAFVKSGQYAELNDPEIDALARRLGRLNKTVNIFFWIGLGAVLAAALAAKS